MSAKRFMAQPLRPLLLALLFLLNVPLSAVSAADMEDLLPPVSCGAGRKIEGKPLFYDRDTLSDRIDGEAELYFPYGFDRMAAARYASEKNPGTGIDVEIYRMGSLLDAFGMYANYRQKDGRSLTVGAESSLSGSQLFLYQGRYFVHIQATGIDAPDPDALTECARTVVAQMPGNGNRPPELAVFDRSEVVKGTERYLPQSLLGYDFLNKGIMTDALVEGANLQIFLLLGTTAESSSAAFDRYRSQLTQWKIEQGDKSTAFLEGVDPLYGPVIVLKKGDCLTGALRFSGKKGIRFLLENICK
ncbi:MAG TPA: DUF6599 family protein [Geobacteraceae bacterium]|nr:DUF6599 family protein [Geobacteraceae bacterium]